MKIKFGFFNWLIYWSNIFVAFLLLFTFLVPYLTPKSFPNLSLLSLVVSPLILINILFCVYWFFKIKSNSFISLIIVVLAYFHFGPFIKLSTKKPTINAQNQLKIFSFNVRLFNFYETKESQRNIPKMMDSYLKKEQPDILCLQEFNKNMNINFSEYPHRYIHFKNKNILGHAIFSKYPLINTYTFNFKDSYNNTIAADIVKGKDTIRIYNLHLQSFSILPSMKYLQELDNEVLRKKVSTRFVKQQNQVDKIIQHKNKSDSPVIISGDFNNTAFSYVYHQLSKDMNDAFLLAGSDIGTTFIFENYPMRIDYLLATKDLKVLDFNTIKKTFSDHYPISATFGWN